MSRATDIYKELKTELERLVPAQSFVPNQIYRAIHRSQIWCALESDALLDMEEIIIQQDVKIYPLTKIFKRISSVTIEDYAGEISYISPSLFAQMQSAYGHIGYPSTPLCFTKFKDHLWFLQNVNDYVDKKTIVLGFAIPNIEPSETQELQLSAIYDQAVKLRALYYLLPLASKERAQFSIEATAELNNIAGKTTNEFTDIKNSNNPAW